MTVSAIRGERKRAQQAVDTRLRILETARNLFASNDPSQVTTRQVAAAAGVAEGLVFHYFPTRSNLLDAAVEGRSALVEAMLLRLDEAQGRPAETALSELARAWLEALMQEKALAALVFTLQSDAPQAEARQAAVQDLRRRMAAYLSGRARAGELRADLPAEAAAQVFLSSMLAFFLENRNLEEGEWRPRAGTFSRELASVLLVGLLHRPAVFGGRGKWNV